jgi:hypothetical protein
MEKMKKAIQRLALIKFWAAAVFTILAYLFSTISTETDIKIVDILVNRDEYIDREVPIEGVVEQFIENTGDPGVNAASCYIRGDYGGVILVKAPKLEKMEVDKRYRLIGVVDYNKYLDETSYIVKIIIPLQANLGDVKVIRLDETGRNAKGKKPSGLAGFVFDSLFNSNSLLSNILLDKIGDQLVETLHFEATHKKTRIICKQGAVVTFKTRYNVFGKSHYLLWELKCHPHTIVSDFRFLYDSHSLPTAKIANKAKGAATTSIKKGYEKLFN